MEFVRKIRESLGLNKYRMASELGFEQASHYTQFENSKKSLNAEKMIRLWEISGLSSDDFLNMIKDEVEATIKPERVRWSERRLASNTPTTACKPNSK